MINTRNMIFVFGSNKAGIHGAGAARYAAMYRGAKMGTGVGRTGQAYAIPTKGEILNTHTSGRTKSIGGTLPLVVIQGYVDDFLEYAEKHPELQFQVTCIGCGLAGLKHEAVAPMFKDAPDNCWFDNLWFKYLTTGAGDRPQHKYWETF